MNRSRKDCWIVGVVYDDDIAEWEPEAFTLTAMQRVSRGQRDASDLLPDLDHRQRGRDLWLTERGAERMAPFLRVHYAEFVGLGGFDGAWQRAEGIARRMNRLIDDANRRAAEGGEGEK